MPRYGNLTFSPVADVRTTQYPQCDSTISEQACRVWALLNYYTIYATSSHPVNHVEFYMERDSNSKRVGLWSS